MSNTYRGSAMVGLIYKKYRDKVEYFLSTLSTKTS